MFLTRCFYFFNSFNRFIYLQINHNL